MCRLCSPSSCAICFQTASSYPSVVSMRRRTSDEGDLASMNLRTASRSCSCSSENAKFIVSPSGSRLTREPEHPLADDVALDLAGPGVDGLGPARHEDARQVAELVVLAGRPLDEIRQLALKRQLLRQERSTTLEAERGQRDLPAVVHLADDVLLVGAGV